MEFLRLYSENSEPDIAYYLASGNVIFYVSKADKYAIKGNNLVVGATELIIKHIVGEHTLRLETLVAPANSAVKKISADKFIQNIANFSFLINTSMVLAKQVTLTNKIINKNSLALEGQDRLLKELAIKYYKGVSALSEEFNKRKLPWINEILKKHITSLDYKKGEAFFKSQDSVVFGELRLLSNKVIEFPRGTLICEENTYGDDLYILQAGSVDVEIGGVRVATIDKAGTVFGEMALLLSEKRSASLRARNNTVVTKISKGELKQLCEKDNSLLKVIAISLAQKHYYNLIKISAINKSLVEHALSQEEGPDKKIGQIENLRSRIAKLKNDIDDAIYKKDADYLKYILGLLE